MNEARKDHWDRIYGSKSDSDLSWHQDAPEISLELAERAGVTPDTRVIDVGAGTSRVVDGLIARGLRDISVLDLSQTALDAQRARLGPRGADVEWIVADITRWSPQRVYDLWHDRAVFHFLVDPSDRDAYVTRLSRALRIGGHAIIATFAPDGPETCSGLPVRRYSPEALGGVLGPDFELVAKRFQKHTTPSGNLQSFQFSLFRKLR
ncbi:SAM-dependent methyltransferase [Thioclava sediminum]|uniref:SAM-dependent methyltransferase n=2 Tax=Thioclava TaxID=285107 RepID=A0ABX3MXR5_9RHOB|nr:MULTISPECIES: class I SAM-dependent methyltransferase [Thioclava]MAQ37124.1 class I SAM-dependent methyltransferase [Thioclava sp.]OOY02904.1 SAM-dependent methyltransferase [Thioclava sp. F28-4]OOY07073.1 SAM-dependent methyltransferase [Thioclava sp. F36-7]OOY17022.1 SAM-dependent methyltransferase [Thioclava sp. DLFJ4-1]OOY19403.1 SAM-dependent methyltransferase [Thioclava sp. DLFJ5-1]